MGKSYQVSIVGESHYQDSIDAECEGHDVVLTHEPDNEYDPRAIRVDNHRGETMGYLPRDGWLTSAILDQRRVAEGWVLRVTGEKKQTKGVVLDVTLKSQTGAARDEVKQAELPETAAPADSERGEQKLKPAYLLAWSALAIAVLVGTCAS